jgi:hypothetical protein
MLGVYLISSAPIVRVISLKTPFGLVNHFITKSSHVTTITIIPHAVKAFTQVTITYTVVTTIAYNTIPSLH